MLIVREEVRLEVDGSPMRVVIARPASGGPWPALFYATDIFGFTGATLRSMERFAGYGFVVASFEMYHRFEPFGTALDFEAERERALADAERVDAAGLDADSAAVIGALARRDDVDAARIFATGFCSGGHVAFRAAMLPQVRKTVAFYGTGIHDGKLGAGGDAGSLGKANDIHGKLLLVFGTRDPHVPEAGRAAIAAALGAAGVRYAMSLYDAEHAFMRDEGPRYDPERADAAFAEAIAFFNS